MKRVLQSTLGVIAMAGLAVAVIWLVRGASGRQDLMAQVTNQPIETEEIQATVTSTVEPMATPTPVIILPEGTSPPIPTPFPTPTSTPINPNENILISLDLPANIGSVSPDGNTLIFSALQEKVKAGIISYSQIWKLDLVSKQITKLVEHGEDPIWSPDGQTLVYQLSSPDGQINEVKIVGVDGQKDHSLLKNRDLLGYYWIDTDQIGLIRTDSIDRINSTGQVKNRVAVKLPVGNSDSTTFQPKVVGHSAGVVILHNKQLVIVQPNGQTITIGEGYEISDFALSPNGQIIAYKISNYPDSSELWISDIMGHNQRKIFELANKHIWLMGWSPDNKVVVAGWSYGGTTITGGKTPILIDVESGQTVELGIDEVNVGLTFSADGQSLYYGRTTFYQNLDPEQEKTTFYQLQVK